MNTTHRYGTHHFCSMDRARDYYRSSGLTFSDVREKLSMGEIELGAPAPPKGGKILLNGEGRYVVEIKERRRA